MTNACNGIFWRRSLRHPLQTGYISHPSYGHHPHRCAAAANLMMQLSSPLVRTLASDVPPVSARHKFLWRLLGGDWLMQGAQMLCRGRVQFLPTGSSRKNGCCMMSSEIIEWTPSSLKGDVLGASKPCRTVEPHEVPTRSKQAVISHN